VYINTIRCISMDISCYKRYTIGTFLFSPVSYSLFYCDSATRYTRYPQATLQAGLQGVAPFSTLATVCILSYASFAWKCTPLQSVDRGDILRRDKRNIKRGSLFLYQETPERGECEHSCNSLYEPGYPGNAARSCLASNVE